MLASRIALFKPFGIFTMAVRNNCPWHRKNFTPFYFPFHMKKKMGKGSLSRRLDTPGGRIIVMKRILSENHFIGWKHQPAPPETRLSDPL